jgi:hypothetical protein
MLVAHTYNPSYSGGFWFWRPYLKNTQHKKVLVEWLKV